MAVVWYTFEVRDDGTLTAGLEPTFVHLKRLTADFPDVTSQPDILEVGDGQYAFAYDPEALGEASAVVDAGSDVAANGDRYLVLRLSRDSSRIQAGISSTGKVVASQLDDKTGVTLGAAGFDLVLVEPDVNAKDALRRIGAAAAGRASGAGTGTMTYYAMGTTNADIPRLEVQTPGNGNRTNVEFV